MNIRDRHVIITGGASGLGRAFAAHLHRQGARVWVLDRREPDPFAEPGAEPRDGLPRYIPCDVRDPDQVEAAVMAVHRLAGRIDGLVNNAAVLKDQALVSGLKGKVRKHSLEAWDETLRTNLTGYFLVAREVAAVMVADRTGGLIVNVSSVSRRGNAGQSAYAASKAGIDALTRTWARELSPYGIRVASLAPGFVATPMTAAIPGLFLEQLRERTPIKRFGTEAEMAAALSFIIGNEYYHGRILELDGGLTL